MGGASQWWALSDLNGRPFGCKPNALTAELSALTQFIVQEAARSVNAQANALVPGDERSARFASVSESQHYVACAQDSGYSCALTGENIYAISPPSLHFVGAASKLTLLHWCKGNAQRCFSYGILLRTL